MPPKAAPAPQVKQEPKKQDPKKSPQPKKQQLKKIPLAEKG